MYHQRLWAVCFLAGCVLSLSAQYYVSGNNIQCSHIPPTRDQVQFVHIESSHAIRKRAAVQKLRIKSFYDESIKKLTREQFTIINETVLPDAINYWQSALFVRPMTSKIKLARKCFNVVYTEAEKDDDIGVGCKEACENETLCGEVVIPPEHLQECRICQAPNDKCFSVPSNFTSEEVGVKDADFILYISAMSTTRCTRGSAIAYAAHCQQEMGLYRPIAGHANICPEAISTKPQDLETLMSTFKHEILHALGFSISLFPYYRDPEGKPYAGLDVHHFGPSSKVFSPIEHKLSPYMNLSGLRAVIRNVLRKNWRIRGGYVDHYVHVVTTPNVLREVRAHFNCSQLEGAELEDQGEEGTQFTHWEKRIFENEAMTGTHTQNPVYSRITLAMMEDTGWFRVNYSLAQNLKWGKNLGCDFAMRSCADWITKRRTAGESIHPFCDRARSDPLQTECMDDRDSVALCNLKRYDHKLERLYQNFDYISHVENDSLAFYGGAVVLADYCPYIQEFHWKTNEVVIRGSECSFKENNPTVDKNFALEYYGPQSKCFDHSEQMWEEKTCTHERQWQHWGSGCYKYKCQDGLLHVIINNNITFTCFEEKQKLNVQIFSNGWLHNGTIVCPKCSEMCSACKTFPKEELHIMKAKYRATKHHLKCSSISTSILGPKDYFQTLSLFFVVITLGFLYV